MLSSEFELKVKNQVIFVQTQAQPPVGLHCFC